MNRILVFMVCVVFTASCGERPEILQEVVYYCDGVTIKRVDRERKITLYYMEKGQRVDSVWYAKDKWFAAPLVFDKDKRVWVETFGKYFSDPTTDKLLSVCTLAEREHADSLMREGRGRVLIPDNIYRESFANQERGTYTTDETGSYVKVSIIEYWRPLWRILLD